MREPVAIDSILMVVVLRVQFVSFDQRLISGQSLFAGAVTGLVNHNQPCVGGSLPSSIFFWLVRGTSTRVLLPFRSYLAVADAVPFTVDPIARRFQFAAGRWGAGISQPLCLS